VSCRTGCLTQDHATWGECARAANFYTDVNPERLASRKAWDGELRDYADLRRQGVQPEGTRRHQVDRARRMADAA
jgi:hypothetical protein